MMICADVKNLLGNKRDRGEKSADRAYNPDPDPDPVPDPDPYPDPDPVPDLMAVM